MDYVFLDSIKVDRYYEKCIRYLSSELKKINDLGLKYSNHNEIKDIEFQEKNLVLYLDILEKRPTWLRVIFSLVLFGSFMQLSSGIYVAFDQGYLNSRQVNIITISFLLTIASFAYLFYEYRKFQENKLKALKVFLIVRHHNYQKIIDEREAKLNPRPKYKKGSPMDYLFGEDE